MKVGIKTVDANGNIIIQVDDFEDLFQGFTLKWERRRLQDYKIE